MDSSRSSSLSSSSLSISIYSQNPIIQSGLLKSRDNINIKVFIATKLLTDCITNSDETFFILLSGFELHVFLSLQILCRWLLTVRKNYRNVIYHNWKHAFNVAQSMFCMLTVCTVIHFLALLLDRRTLVALCSPFLKRNFKDIWCFITKCSYN